MSLVGQFFIANIATGGNAGFAVALLQGTLTVAAALLVAAALTSWNDSLGLCGIFTPFCPTT